MKILDFIPNITSFQILIKVINETLNLNITFENFMVLFNKKIANAEIKLMPGVEKVVKHLYDNNYPIAIATGNSK